MGQMAQFRDRRVQSIQQLQQIAPSLAGPRCLLGLDQFSLILGAHLIQQYDVLQKVARSGPIAVQRLQDPADEKPGEARHCGRGGGIVNLLRWAIDPWGKIVPIHIAWFLIWVAAIAGLLFVIVHAIYVRYFAKPRHFERDPVPVDPARIPAQVPRHSVVARAFHWVMAASMLTLLLTAFLPKAGVQFDWVTLIFAFSM